MNTHKGERSGCSLLFEVLNVIKLYWLQFLLATSSIALAKALSDEIVMKHPSGGASRIARFVLGCYIAVFFYGVFYFLITLIFSQIVLGG